MRLLYLSYWSAADPLTQATVCPHLEILARSARIERLMFASVERGATDASERGCEGSRVAHVALRSRSFAPVIAARAVDFMELPAALGRLCRTHGITRVLARGSPAGGLAHLMQRHAKVPYIVESFEPHAAYMLESGVWHRWDPRYVFQKRWEKAQTREASVLLPVTESYREVLIREGARPDAVVTLPCTVDTEAFRFSTAHREQLRLELGMSEATILGICVGKFGDIYYDREAFQVFAHFARRLPDFRLAVLTPMRHSSVRELASKSGFPLDRLFVATVRHAEVARYLSAADVGFAMYRMAPSRRFLSPVKVGEYWACGLPIVITDGVGDDSEITRTRDGGAVVTLAEEDLDRGVERIRRLLAEPGHRERIAEIARVHRDRRRVDEAYKRIGLL